MMELEGRSNVDREQLLERLRIDFPELKLRSIEVLGTGWDHVALETDDIVFRIPKDTEPDPARETQVQTEVAMLQQLQGKLPVAIPKPLYVAPNNEYFGYPKLEGVVAALRKQLIRDDQERSIKQWVEISAAIHQTIDRDVARRLGVPDTDPAPVVELTRGIFNLDGVPREFLAFARRTFDQVDSIQLQPERFAFLHADFHGKNILLDPTTHDMVGLIDWSDLMVGPIEQEFWVWEWTPGDALEQAAARYQELTNVSVNVAETRAWAHLNELSDYVEQTKSGDQAGAEDSAGHIRRWIGEGK